MSDGLKGNLMNMFKGNLLKIKNKEELSVSKKIEAASYGEPKRNCLMKKIDYVKLLAGLYGKSIAEMTDLFKDVGYA